MRTGWLGIFLDNIRTALICALFVVASLPQVAGAHAQNGSGLQTPQALDQVMVSHPNPLSMTSAHCQLGQECSALAIMVDHNDGPQQASAPSSPYLPFQTLMTSWPVSFDPPPPRFLL